MKPWATFKCVRCDFTTKQRSGTQSWHTCPKVTPYDVKKWGDQIAEMKEIKPDEDPAV